MADAVLPFDTPYAFLGGRLATGLAEVSDDPAVLDGSGWWAVVGTFEGRWWFARFDDVRAADLPAAGWPGVPRDSWRTSMDAPTYRAAVERVRQHIAAGDVYQANICRMLTAPLPPGAHLGGLATGLAAGNPAPYGGVVHLPEHGLQVATASPEQYLRRRGDVVESSPVKGTGRTAADLLPKDSAENVMIVDLVRNDLGRVALPGTVEVPSLLRHEMHPGLVHLVSTVQARLRPDVGWAELLAATFPPGSVTGAPKIRALEIIEALEAGPRGPYCGAVGWVDGDRQEAELAVAIRTFFVDGDTLCFGTGAGITWGSDPALEWDETELKAERLLSVAAVERDVERGDR